MRPPFAYYGGKIGLAGEIVRLMPAHRVYIEPFLGSGAVLFAKPPSRIEIVNDLDDRVVTFFRVLRDRPEDLELACRLTPYARGEWETAEAPTEDDVEIARRFWCRVTQSFGKTAGTSTGWSVTTARSQSVARTARSQLGRFRAVADRLASVVIERCDAADLVARLATPDSVVYCDPPYVARTRRRGRGSRYSDYRVDMGDEDAHRRLADVLRATPATVLLSGYHGPLYDELYGDWWRTEWRVHAHSSNAVAPSRDGRVEVLWSNRDLGCDLRLPGT